MMICDGWQTTSVMAIVGNSRACGTCPSGEEAAQIQPVSARQAHRGGPECRQSRYILSGETASPDFMRNLQFIFTKNVGL